MHWSSHAATQEAGEPVTVVDSTLLLLPLTSKILEWESQLPFLTCSSDYQMIISNTVPFYDTHLEEIEIPIFMPFIRTPMI